MKRPAILRARRLIYAVLGFALLAGCNFVESDKPWFATTAAANATRLREGVWLGSSNLSTTPCAVDERQPIDAWPDCARPVLVQKFDLIELSKDRGRWRRTTFRYVLADGQPFILQVGASQNGKTIYEFEWIRVTGLDDQGRVIAFSGGPVLCGAPDLYPGLVKRDTECTASSLSALRGAAQASDAGATPMGEGHWVRDGSR